MKSNRLVSGIAAAHSNWHNRHAKHWKADAVDERPWKRVLDVIMQTLRLVRNGQTEEAFAAIDSAIAEVPEQRRTELKVLLCHAAALAMGRGDRDREIEYTKRALPYAKDYSFAAYNFSQLLLKDGQVDLARQYASEAYKLSYRSEADADRDLVKAIRQQWPNIAIDE